MTTKITYNIQLFQNSKLINQETPIKLKISELNPMYTVHRSISQQLITQRQGNANSKTRSEVKGSGKKPWKQKGTGKARAGSIRSPLWRGGGIVFGPRTKTYNLKINQKERQLAIRNMLYNRRNVTIAVDQDFFKLEKPKTKEFIEKRKLLNINSYYKLLIIVAQKNLNVYLATRNLENVEVLTFNQINSLSIIKAQYIIIEKEAIQKIQSIYHG